MPFNFQSIETSLGSLVEENEDLEKLMNWEQGKKLKQNRNRKKIFVK